MLVCPRPMLGFPQPCAGEPAQSEIAAALTRIRTTVDPCGESPLVLAMLDKLERCTATSYQICTNPESERSWFDRPLDGATLRTIMWNPALRTQLEADCDGDVGAPVLRDATASLLHELAHAAQDCDGLNPGEHEFEAVRVENIYRRAAGLCQRSKYGDEPLPLDSVTACTPGNCHCSPPVDARDPLPILAAPSRPATAPPVAADAQPNPPPALADATKIYISHCNPGRQTRPYNAIPRPRPQLRPPAVWHTSGSQFSLARTCAPEGGRTP